MATWIASLFASSSKPKCRAIIYLRPFISMDFMWYYLKMDFKWRILLHSVLNKSNQSNAARLNAMPNLDWLIKRESHTLRNVKENCLPHPIQFDTSVSSAHFLPMNLLVIICNTTTPLNSNLDFLKYVHALKCCLQW